MPPGGTNPDAVGFHFRRLPTSVQDARDMLAFSYLPGSYSLIRFVLIPAVFVAMACGVAVHDAVRFKAPLRKRLMLGAVGAAGVGLFLYFVIKIYVLSYWE